MDENDLDKKSRRYCVGVALHEAMHVWMSRTEFFTDEEWAQLGFAIGFNFAEDCGIENAAERVHRDGKELIKDHLDVDVAKGGGLDIDINKTINSSLGYIPKHMILGGVMRQYFHGRQIAGTLNVGGKVGQYGIDPYTTIDPQKMDEFNQRIEGIDPDVRAAFDQIRPLLEKFWEAVPEMYDNEEEIRKYAEARAHVYRDIFDIYKTLIEQSVQDQALKDFVEELVKGGKFTTAPLPGGGQAIVIDFDSLPPEVQEELEKLLGGQNDQEDDQAQGQQDAQQGGQMKPGTGPSAAGGSPSPGTATSQEGDSTEQAPQPQPAEAGEASAKAEGDMEGPTKPGQATEMAEGASSEKDSAAGQVPWDKVSPEAKEKIKEQFDKVDPSQQEGLKEKAEQQLGETEDKVNEKIEGKSDKEGVSRPTKLGKKKPGNKESGKDGGKQGGEQGDQGEQQEQGAQSDSQSEAGQGQESPGQSSSSSSSSSSKESADQSSPPSQGESEGQQTADKSGQPAEGEFQRTGREKDDSSPKSPEKTVDTSMTHDEERQLERFYQNLNMDMSGLTEFDMVANQPELKDASAELRSRLEPIFKPRQKRRRRYGESSDQVDLDRVIQYKMGETNSREFMFSEERPTRMNYRFTILVDLSGSMTNKLAEVFKMLVILSENLAYLGIEFEVQGFTDGLNGPASVLKTYKGYEENENFGEVLSDDAKNRIGGMMYERLGGTPTGRAMLESFDRLKQRNQVTANQGKKLDIMLVLTDGQPTDYFQNVDLSPEELMQAIISQMKGDALSEQMLLTILGFGIGPGTHFVNDVFPTLPFGLRNEIANKINSFYADKQVSTKPGYVEATAESVGSSFVDTFELTIVLPIIFEYIVKNPREFIEKKIV
jgi:hypothetical protein